MGYETLPPAKPKRFDPDDLLTAKGKQTRNHGSSKLPFSSLECDATTYHERVWWCAQKHSQPVVKCKCIAKMIEDCEADILELAHDKGWKSITDKANAFARIVIAPLIGDHRPYTNQAAAELMGIEERSYYKTWRQRVEFVKAHWVQDWRRRV